MHHSISHIHFRHFLIVHIISPVKKYISLYFRMVVTLGEVMAGCVPRDINNYHTTTNKIVSTLWLLIGHCPRTFLPLRSRLRWYLVVCTGKESKTNSSLRACVRACVRACLRACKPSLSVAPVRDGAVKQAVSFLVNQPEYVFTYER